MYPWEGRRRQGSPRTFRRVGGGAVKLGNSQPIYELSSQRALMSGDSKTPGRPQAQGRFYRGSWEPQARAPLPTPAQVGVWGIDGCTQMHRLARWGWMGRSNCRRRTGLINAPKPLRRLMCGQGETNECNLFRLSKRLQTNGCF